MHSRFFYLSIHVLCRVYLCRNGDPGIACDGNSEHLIGRSSAVQKFVCNFATSPYLVCKSPEPTSSVAFVLILLNVKVPCTIDNVMPVPLLTSVDCTNQVHLVIGDNGIASKRVTRSLEAGAACVLISPLNISELHFELKNLVEKRSVKHIQREFQEGDLRTLGRAEVDNVVDMVFITLSPLDKRSIIIY